MFYQMCKMLYLLSYEIISLNFCYACPKSQTAEEQRDTEDVVCTPKVNAVAACKST